MTPAPQSTSPSLRRALINFWNALSNKNRLIVAGVAVVLVIVLSNGVANAVRPPAPAQLAFADSSSSPAPGGSAQPVERKPVVTTEQTTQTEAIPFTSSTIDDPNLPSGTTAITTVGVAGVRTIVTKIVYTDGKESARVVLSDSVTTPPVAEVISKGTYVAPPPPIAFVAPSGGCDPNYAGCVPIDSDVDCAGGSGNGPSYQDGPVAVIGSDIYDLDRDGNGVGCD